MNSRNRNFIEFLIESDKTIVECPQNQNICQLWHGAVWSEALVTYITNTMDAFTPKFFYGCWLFPNTFHHETTSLKMTTNMMTSSNENIFRVTGPLWRESTGDRWIPLTKASNTELWCFLWSAPEPEPTIETPVIWDAIVLIMTSL